MRQNRSLDRLREIAQDLADEFGEDVLLIPDPPARPLSGFKGAIPYACLAAHAGKEEKAAATEIFNPRSKTCLNKPSADPAAPTSSGAEPKAAI